MRTPESKPANGGARLVAREEEIARRWITALVAGETLADLATLELAPLAGQARAASAAVIEAVAHGPTPPSPDARLALRAAGRGEPSRIAAACELLRGVTWRALREECDEPGGELADRLAAACAALLALALAADAPSAPPVERGPMARGGALIVDEATGRAVAGEPTVEVPEFALRDERPRVRSSRWSASVRARLDRYRADGLPFALLLAELSDLSLLGAAEPPAAMERIAATVERAIAADLAAGDGEPVCERPGRWWIVSGVHERAAARLLAERLADAARIVVDGRGEPLELAVGIALCPADGHEFSELSSQAEVALYAARSQARAVERRFSALD